MVNDNSKKILQKSFIIFIRKYISVFFLCTIIGYLYYLIVTPLLTEIPFLWICVLSKNVSCKWAFDNFYYMYPSTIDEFVFSLLVYIPGAIFAFGLPGMAMVENMTNRKSNKTVFRYFIVINSIFHIIPIIITSML